MTDTLIGCVQHDCKHCKEQAAKLEELTAENKQLQRDFTYIKHRRDALLVALEKLARLGNGDRYGNSEGNAIAIAALNGGYAP